MTTIETQTSFGANHSPDSRSTQPQLSITQSLSNDPSLQEDYSISQLMEKSLKKEFPKKIFLVDGKFKSLTSILHFYKSLRILSLNDSKNNVEFTCKLCKLVSPCKMKDFSNLYKHLKCHKEFFEWYEVYQKRGRKVKIFKIF